MSFLPEVIITSCLNDPTVSALMYDAQNGTLLKNYRGDTSVPACGLSMLAGEYIVAALQNKPFLRVWAVNGQQQLTTRLVCPGRVTHAAVNPNRCFIAVTVAEKVHLYQFATGKLVGSGSQHFQPITVLRWSVDGNQLVCGGEDGLVTVWTLTSLATPQNSREPRWVLSDHSLPVTDLVVTRGSRPRLMSVSADRTCKIYDLTNGTLLLSLVFDKVLTAVAVSALESEVFVGTDSGPVLQFNLLSPPRQQQYHLTAEECAPVFVGHTASVRCLSASGCGTLLLSGSSDASVKVWDISSKQCLRSLMHKGPITNAFFCPQPQQLFSFEIQPSVVISDFLSSGSEEPVYVSVITRQPLRLRDADELPEPPIFPTASSSSDGAKIQSLETELASLRVINENLYKFAVDKIIKENSFMPEESKKEILTELQPSRKRKRKKSAATAKKKLNTVTVSVKKSTKPLASSKKKRRKKNKLSNK